MEVRKVLNPISKLVNYLSMAAAYVRLNFFAQMEYKAAFWSQVIGMVLNNCVWIVFWTIFFKRFDNVGGWTVQDVLTVWSISAGGYGLAYCICGNALGLAAMISNGRLDAWMLYPRALLSHILVGRMSATAFGDILFAVFVYGFFVKPDLLHFVWFCALTVSAAIVFVGFSVLTSCLSFYLGNAEGLAETSRFALITFSTYPASLFQGGLKLLLYTVIPAGLVSYLPVEALRDLSVELTLMCFGGSLSILAVGVGVFYWGLRRYESGNLMEMRG